MIPRGLGRAIEGLVRKGVLPLPLGISTTALLCPMQVREGEGEDAPRREVVVSVGLVYYPEEACGR